MRCCYLNGATITLLIGVISCIIGVLTFISGRISKAEQDGRLSEKLDTCAKGIEEIKIKLDGQESIQNQQNVMINSHEIILKNHTEKIEHIENTLESLKGGSHQ